MAEPVRAVRRDLEFEHGFHREEILQRGARHARRVQNEQAFGILGELQFLRAAHHALAFDAAQLAGLDFEIPRQHRSRQRQWHLVADLVVFRAAHDLARLPRTVIHLAHAKAVGIRMLDGFQHLRDHDLVDGNTTAPHPGNLKACTPQQRLEFGNGKLAIDKVAEPVE